MRKTRSKQVKRTDGFSNAMLGIGRNPYDPYNKFTFSQIEMELTNEQLENLFTYNGIANKIITAPVDDAIRAGFSIEYGDNELVQDDKLQSVLEDLKLERVLKEAVSWDRLFGGALIVLRINDGGELEDILNEQSIKSIDDIQVFDTGAVSINYTYSDPENVKYGKPEIYTVSTATGSFDVHETRCIRLIGDLLPRNTRINRQGWGANVLERLQAELMNYNISLRNALMILQRLSQSVFKFNQLATILSAPGGEELVRKRMNLIDQARSIDNSVVLDGLDEYQQHNATLSGVLDVINAFQTSLSAVTDIPITRLFGQSPAGQNATGKSDMNNYYNMIEGIRVNKIKPVVLRVVDLIDKASDYNVTLPQFWTIEFNPLESLDEKKEAETNKLKAETDKLKAEYYTTLVSIGALDGKEVRNTIQESGEFKTENVPDDEEE
nr:MAG TPA: Portal [Caudoviricetes sp.]